jgi:hypothetical protein
MTEDTREQLAEYLDQNTMLAVPGISRRPVVKPPSESEPGWQWLPVALLFLSGFIVTLLQ